MQLIGQILGSIPADIAGTIAVIASLSAIGLLRLDQTRKAARANKHGRTVAKPTPPARRLESARDWTMVAQPTLTALARAPDMQALHVQAALQIDAAEHALNRLIAECARVGYQVAWPTFEPAQQLAREPVAQPRPRKQPLAA